MKIVEQGVYIFVVEDDGTMVWKCNKGAKDVMKRAQYVLDTLMKETTVLCDKELAEHFLALASFARSESILDTECWFMVRRVLKTYPELMEEWGYMYCD